MSAEGYQVPETLLKVVGGNRGYSIYLLDGKEIIFSPPDPKGNGTSAMFTVRASIGGPPKRR
ncbi:MAG: hypothetical protein KAJ09_08140 [Deltaproteobacteria bacterium]|nr:hypothetical protein [Deltaproteobacteria bacterium]